MNNLTYIATETLTLLATMPNLQTVHTDIISPLHDWLAFPAWFIFF